MALHNTLTRREFEDKVLGSDKLVLVDFWAKWCPPCRMMAPILEKIAEMEGIDVVKLDVEESPDNQRLAAEHGVQGIPNMQVFKSGQKVDELVGMRPEGVLRDELNKHI